EHAGALGRAEDLLELALPIDQLRRAAGARLEDARIEAEVEAAAPGVDVQRRARGGEDLHHALRREEAVREADGRWRLHLAAPGAIDVHIDARGDHAPHELFPVR